MQLLLSSQYHKNSTFRWYQSITLPIRFGSGTTQEKAIGKERLEVDEGGELLPLHKTWK
ncbi:hypothetical protein MTR_3g046505 [Medicago truncatula]|uniref:Uncharacterized protein n=1 Tax=Medicago truncatula TaxID=3880 RepID=A0A072UVB2_MEDTR|nr:hypothetical protein MTR_3g046505 [Medicago truncatula]